MNQDFVKITNTIQQLYANPNYKPIQSLLGSLLKEFLVKNIDNITQIINQIKTQKLENVDYRYLYYLFNIIYDPIIENGYKSVYTYNISNIQKAINHFNNPNKNLKKSIIISTTTCKRTDLIQKTIDSFLECALDYTEYVSEWIIVDDNSSESDRNLMKEKYPFITYIYKNIENKGHPRSMNIIRDYVITKNADYVFNLEDDWEFFVKDNYFQKMVNVIEQDSSFGQCLLNINYSEDTKSGQNLWGAEEKFTSEDQRYFIHRHYQGKELENITKSSKFSNCFYWPHYSLRVGITKTSVLKEVGEFNEKAQHFEMEYAYRYISKNYQTTFLDGIFCSHIGRRTYERNSTKLNAYDLNSEQQFGEPLKKVENTQNSVSDNKQIKNTIKEDNILPGPGPGLPGPGPGLSDNEVGLQNKIVNEVICYVINLERRFDRLQSFFEQNKNENIPIQIFSAFDGKSMNPSHKIQKAFKSGDYNYRRGIVGCAMSHIYLWKKFLQEQTQSYMIVLEDDAKLTKDFRNKLMYLINKYKNQFEIMFLHYNPYPQYNNINLYLKTKIPIAEEWSVERSMKENMGSTACYIISRDGARNMLKHVEKYGMYNAVDWVMFKSPMDKSIKQRIMYSNPMLVEANCFQTSNGADTDVQKDFSSLSFKDKLDWDIYEIKDLSNILLKSSLDNDKKVVFMVEEDLQKIDYYYNDILTLVENKDNIVKNPRKYLRIMFLNKPKQGYIKDCICLVPIYKRSEKEVESIKKGILEIINNSAVEYYTTNNFIYTIPQIYINEEFQKSKVWGDGYLNTVSPF